MSHRTHAVVWSDWASQAEVERAHGIRLDTNYYFYPAPWVGGRSGYFTGSGLPMRFASATGEVIDCFQTATLLTDESGQIFPDAIDDALDRALHPETGHVAVLTANMHTDFGSSIGSDAIVAAAMQRGVPVISARQLLEWLDARSAATVTSIEHTPSGLRFSVDVPDDTRHLELVVPVPAGVGAVLVQHDGRNVSSTHEQIGGVTHVHVAALGGDYDLRWEDGLHSASSVPRVEVAQTSLRSPTLVHGRRDFATSGRLDGVIASAASNGSLTLEGDLTLEPTQGVGPGWSLDGSSSQRSDDGRTIALAGSLRSHDTFAAPSALEVGAVLGSHPGARLALVGDGDRPLAAFNTESDGSLLVMVHDDTGRRIRQPVPGTWSEGEHRFRIDWDDGLATFTIDGRAVASVRARVPGPLRAELRGPADGSPLRVLWARGAGFPSSGTYTSDVLDLTDPVRWGPIVLVAPAQTLTGARSAVRAGDTPIPDDSWSSWITCGPRHQATPDRHRYGQYRVELLTRSALWTPEVIGVRVHTEA